MFYSHEVLTSRQYGVATVWLVATLGAKSTLKKVNRKAILEVNVPKACETIISPEAPMALRLQSNLLYGVTRVYGEQCSYVLVDAQTAQNNMRALLRSFKPAELERKHMAKPEQLNLKEDTQFSLEDLLIFDLDSAGNPDLSSSNASDLDSLLSPGRSVSTALGSEHADPTLGGIIIPTSASSSVVGAGGFSIGGSSRGGSGRGSRFGSSLFRREEDDRLFDPGFAFDDMGNIVDSPPDPTNGVVTEQYHPTLKDPAALIDKPEMEPEVQDPGNTFDDDAFLPQPEDLGMYADAEAFLPRSHRSENPSSRQASVSVHQSEQAEPNSEGTTEEFASAPAVRARKKRGIAPDVQQELHNYDLSEWSNNYLTHMQDVMNGKTQARSTALAKRNADFWVLQNGVGSLGVTYGQESIPEPLRMFTGNALIEGLTGLRLTTLGEKHARQEGRDDMEDGVGEDGRRVRARSDKDENGRGYGSTVLSAIEHARDDLGYIRDDTGYLGSAPADEPRDEAIEVGRGARTPLAEHPSSIMPWNNTASIRGSSVRPVGGLGIPFLAGGVSSSVVGEPISGLGRGTSRVGSRLVSASPLGGRGDACATFEPIGDVTVPDSGPDYMQDARSVRDEGQESQQAHPDNAPNEDYEVFGPAALVPTQQTNHPTWIHQVLDSQSINFLTFIQVKIQEVNGSRQVGPETVNVTTEESGSPGDTISFETLLTPVENNRIVAAQGLLHVLTLATKKLLHADQKTSFGPIQLRVHEDLDTVEPGETVET